MKNTRQVQSVASLYDQIWKFEMTMYDAGLIYTALRQYAVNCIAYHHDKHAFVKEIMEVIIDWDEKVSHSSFYFCYKTGSECPLFAITHDCKTDHPDYLTVKFAVEMPFRSWQIINAALRTLSKDPKDIPKYYQQYDRGYCEYKRKRVTPQMHMEYSDLISCRIDNLLRMLYDADDKRLSAEKESTINPVE